MLTRAWNWLSRSVGVGANATAGVCVFRNTAAVMCNHGFNSASISTFQFCTSAHNSTGFANNNKVSTITNCAVILNKTNDFLDAGGATMSYSASSNASAHGTGSVTGKKTAEVKFWDANNGGAGGVDPRILSTSDLVGAGVAIGGITTDGDGNTRADPPAMGWHEGTATAYPGLGGGGLLGPNKRGGKQ